MKFISQTGKDGKCHLVTRAQLEAAGVVCAIQGEQNEGETKGCSVRAGQVNDVLRRHADRIAEINGPETETETTEPDPNATRHEGEADVVIPDNDTAGAAIAINVEAEGTVSQVTVEVEIEHTYISDLTVTLSHDGVSEDLHAKTGGSEDNLSLNVSSEKFAGTSAGGEWLLTVIDSAAQDTGTVKSFAISL